MTKTIVEKLNLQKYKTATVLGLPDNADYFAELTDYDTELSKSAYDLIFAFVLDMESLKELVQKVIENDYLNKNGYLFIAYPKKGNKVYQTFIHRDDLLDGLGADEDGYVGTSSIKFSRMVGLDDVFTVVGLKEDSRNRNNTSTKASKRVDDYVALIPDVEKELYETQDLLAFFQALTLGYRKGWARYVYSAKQEVTRTKRIEEMKIILRAGYKSHDLYRRDH